MDDWLILAEAAPWDVVFAAAATVRPPDRPFCPTPQFSAVFPRLATLLGCARQSAVGLPSGEHLLFAWGRPGPGIRAWLCPIPPESVAADAAPDHRVLLGCFGGIAKRFNEPEGNWLLNHNHSLTAAEVTRGAAAELAAYSWAFEECGGIPIEVGSWYPASWEANGNCVLCSRGTGELLFFAPDHANSNLVPFGRCPMYTLHTHRGVSSLRQ